MLVLTAFCLQTITGCSRRFWRQQADRESYRAVAEKLNDDRWLVPRLDTTPDHRSRFHDPYDPDFEPLPPDDPAAHQYMHRVAGIRGSNRWHDFGDAPSMENPSWLEPYSVFLESGDPVAGHSQVEIPKVTLKDSLELSYIHSREYQTEIEDVYLAALLVTQRRYQLGTRFLVDGIGDLGGVTVGGGGVGARSGVGGGLFNSALRRGNENNTGSFSYGFGVTRLMPWGMQVGADILNVLSWDTDGSASATSLAWNITQPVLNNAGRKVVLEALTQSERTLLYEVRTLARFRQELFTDVASDYLRIVQQLQNIINLRNNIRQLEEQIEIGKAQDNRVPRQVTEPLEQTPEGFEIPEALQPFLRYDEDLKILKWTGPLSDEQRQMLLDLSDDSVYQSSVQQLIRWKETQVVSLSVAQLVTRLNRQQNDLEDAQRQLADLEDSFKVRLGLPPNIRLTINDVLLNQFQLIDPGLVAIDEELQNLAKQRGPELMQSGNEVDQDADPPPDFTVLKSYVGELRTLSDKVRVNALDGVKADFTPVREILATTDDDTSRVTAGQRYFTAEEERQRVIQDVARDLRLFRINERDYEQTDDAISLLENLLTHPDAASMIKALDTNGDAAIDNDELPSGWKNLPGAASAKSDEALTPEKILTGLRNAAMGLREDLRQIAQSQQVVQVGLRVEAITLNPLRLPGEQETPGIEKVVQVGLENRHDLMNARAAVMDSRRAVELAAKALMATLNLRASGESDLDGHLGDDEVSFSVDVKSPMTQIAQRNAYNTALVEYQRQRRTYMALEDTVKQQIRQSWRQLMVSEERLEIDRQTVRNAALQYDNAALEATRGGQGNALNLLNALDTVLQAQNSLVRDWITYETNRLNIFRDMGIMQIDSDGVWEDEFYLSDGQIDSSDMPAPAELYPELQPDPAPPAPDPSLMPEIPEND